MILSHRHQFIFIKTSKTAGTSVEIALSRHCGPDDIITPISPEDESTRRELGGVGPQNHRPPPGPDGRPQGRRAGFYNHMCATEIQALIPAQMWDDYFTFCIERNPWDRIISLYYWRNREEPRPTVRDFLESDEPDRLRTKGRDLYTIDGEVVVDRILRYESLEEELEEVRQLLGIPVPLELPRTKAQFRTDRRPYQELLTPEEAQLVASRFDREIELLGYTFGP